MQEASYAPDELSSLKRAIEAIKKTIESDPISIGAYEARTRYSLIDPLLRALGWSDYSVVTPEYHVKYGPVPFYNPRADYALHDPGRRGHPVAFIEAKRMKEDLVVGHYDQVFEYARQRSNSVRWFALTNGDVWKFYEVAEKQPKPIGTISIRTQSASECANVLLRFLRLPTVPQENTSGEPLHHSPNAFSVAMFQLFRGVDVHKVLIYFAILFVPSCIAGSFDRLLREADPIPYPAYIGLLAAPIGIFFAIGLALRIFPNHARRAWKWLIVRPLIRATDDNTPTLSWVLGGIPVGAITGFVVGRFSGYMTASVSSSTFSSSLAPSPYGDLSRWWS